MSDSEVSYNQAQSLFCSGIVVLLGSVTLTDGSQVNGNRNNGPGGGIAVNFLGSVTVTGHSQVDDNTGAGMGGGIVNFASPLLQGRDPSGQRGEWQHIDQRGFNW